MGFGFGSQFLNPRLCLFFPKLCLWDVRPLSLSPFRMGFGFTVGLRAEKVPESLGFCVLRVGSGFRVFRVNPGVCEVPVKKGLAEPATAQMFRLAVQAEGLGPLNPETLDLAKPRNHEGLEFRVYGLGFRV